MININGGFVMYYDTAYFKIVLLVMIASLLASCAGIDETHSSEGKSVSPGELVNLSGGGSVRAPEGSGWKIVKPKIAGEQISFEKYDHDESRFKTDISIFLDYATSNLSNQTEDQVAEWIFDNEERIMREQGSVKSYFLKEISRENTIIGNKKIHVMKYTISDYRRVPLEIKYAYYLYFPNYEKYPKRYYSFSIADIFKETISGITVEFETDLNVINKVIESLHVD